MHNRLPVPKTGGAVHGLVISCTRLNTGWIMHEDLGWLFVFAQPDRSIWIWKEETEEVGVYLNYESTTHSTTQKFLNSRNGWLFVRINKWAYHQHLIYLHKDNYDDNQRNWLVWSQDSADWLYLMPTESGSLFYDYSTRSLK